MYLWDSNITVSFSIFKVNNYCIIFSFGQRFYLYELYMKIRWLNDKGMNQTILVTGGTSGLGLELVRIFLKKGYSVVTTGRQQINMQWI